MSKYVTSHRVLRGTSAAVHAVTRWDDALVGTLCGVGCAGSDPATGPVDCDLCLLMATFVDAYGLS